MNKVVFNVKGKKEEWVNLVRDFINKEGLRPWEIDTGIKAINSEDIVVMEFRVIPFKKGSKVQLAYINNNYLTDFKAYASEELKGSTTTNLTKVKNSITTVITGLLMVFIAVPLLVNVTSIIPLLEANTILLKAVMMTLLCGGMVLTVSGLLSLIKG